MKKGLLLFGAASLFTLGLNAQTVGVVKKATGYQNATLNTAEVGQAGSALSPNRALYWQNDFSVPADWTFGNNSPQGTFQIGNNTNIGTQLTDYMGAMQSTTNANGFAFFNGIQYVIAGNAVVQDSWVQTANDIDLTGATVITVEFEQRYKAFNVDQVFIELSLDGGATWEVKELNATVATNTYAIATQTVNFNIVGTATAKLRFHWKAPLANGGAQFSSGYGWMVDDVKISDAPANNMVVTEINRGEYSKYPLGQERPVTFWAKARNDGATAQTAVTLEVTANATSVGTSAGSTVAPFASDSLVLTADYAFAGLGVKNLVYTVTQAATDDVPADNTKSTAIEVVNNVFSRDNDTYAGFGFASYTFNGTLPAWGVGTTFELVATADATSISFVLDDQTVAGATVQALILKPEGTELVVVAESDFYTIKTTDIPTATGANPVSVRLDFFNLPVELEAGEYLVAIKHEDEEVSIAYVPNTNTDDVLVYLNDTGGADWFGSTDGIEEAMIRLNLNEAGVGINENAATTSVSIFPNPTADVVNITMRDYSGMSNVKIYNMNGQEVLSEMVNVTSSTFVKTIDVSNFAAGVYNISIISDNGISNHKVAVK